jgi:hypothetical protein
MKRCNMNTWHRASSCAGNIGHMAQTLHEQLFLIPRTLQIIKINCCRSLRYERNGMQRDSGPRVLTLKMSGISAQVKEWQRSSGGQERSTHVLRQSFFCGPGTTSGWLEKISETEDRGRLQYLYGLQDRMQIVTAPIAEHSGNWPRSCLFLFICSTWPSPHNSSIIFGGNLPAREKLIGSLQLRTCI